jgi:hypothetical protein
LLEKLRKPSKVLLQHRRGYYLSRHSGSNPTKARPRENAFLSVSISRSCVAIRFGINNNATLPQ